jgi:DNA-binding SARP family transcriptional activator/tetratricopeptide (TPR) repeat protein
VIQLRLFGSSDLRQEEGSAALSILAQPKRFALLVWLALARPHGFHRRDTLLALFWPELDSEHARAALRKTVYHLRQALGADVVVNRGDEEIGLGGVLWCDAVAFQEAIAAGRTEEALSLYRGDLLPGFFLSDVPEFERWLDTERERLRRQAVAGAWALAGKAESHGSPDAVGWAHRAMALSPEDEAGLRRLLVLLDRGGDRDAALRVYEEHRIRHAEAYDAEPAAETQALIERIRARSGALVDSRDLPSAGAESAPSLRSTAPLAAGGHHRPAPAPFADSQAPPLSAPTAAPDSRSTSRLPWQIRPIRWAAAVATVAIVIVAALAIPSPYGDAPAGPATVAIGHIRDFTGSGSASIAEALPDLLATNLSRAPELQVVSPTRIHEMLARGDPAPKAGAVLAAAREAGADQMIEGALYPQPDGTLRLDLRRVRLRDASVLSSHTVLGPDAFSLVDRATTEILRGWGSVSHELRVADVTTHSLVAYRFYQQGVRSYYRGELNTATRLFDAALEESSGFAMAAYYASLSTSQNWQHSMQYLARAMEMLEHATPRERLLVRARWADQQNDPVGLAIAETLAVRYPAEPNGHFLLGHMQTWAGDFQAAIPRLWTALKMDSTILVGDHARCGACDALGGLVTAYALADSLPAAERIARDWVRRFPTSAGALDALAKTLEYQGQVREAMELRRRTASLHPAAGNLGVWLWPGIYAIRAGHWEMADRFLRMRAEVGTRGERNEALWYLAISLRYQGRLREAREIARQLRAFTDPPPRPGDPPPYSALTEAIVLFEMGRTREAAALWDSLANLSPRTGVTPSQARHRAWMLTHAATALHAAGDTVALKRLIPRIQAYGQQSAYGRDPRLHYHARGLLYAARGDDARAAAEFRQAIFSTTGGYTRTNLELARALLRLRRPREAIPILRAAFRGPLEASNLYVTHTELHEALGQAFDAAGQPDSAAVHRCWVAQARKQADPQFRSLDLRRCAGSQPSRSAQ